MPQNILKICFMSKKNVTVEDGLPELSGILKFPLELLTVIFNFVHEDRSPGSKADYPIPQHRRETNLGQAMKMLANGDKFESSRQSHTLARVVVS